MRFRQESCDIEIHADKGPGGILMHGDISKRRGELLARYGGRVQSLYLDPPFNTGKDFVLRQYCGADGWASGKPALELPAYSDRWSSDDVFLAMLRDAVCLSRDLLRDDGSFFLHIDSRMHARVRLLLDEVFGERNFINEIIWTYQTGGRSTRRFSRKHDIILFYRKEKDAYFDIEAVGMPRAGSRSNHMRRATDEQGRTYRSIVSYGKEYRYYDDELVFPTDVWDDISHLQQKDPQRTGYDNQKPVQLLERIVLCSSRPGDLVCDLFSGSGTTAVAAAKHGRRFLVMDSAEPAFVAARRRLLGCSMHVEGACVDGAPELHGEIQRVLGFIRIRLSAYELERGLCPLALSGVEAVDQCSAGYLRGGIFHALDSAARSKATPMLPDVLEIPVLDGKPALLTVDVLGRRMVHVLEAEYGEQI